NSQSHAPPAPDAEALGARRIAALCLAGAWAGGVGFLLARWAVGSRVLRRLRRTAVPLTGPAAELLTRCRTELGGRAGVAPAAHPGSRSRVVFGLWRPTVLAPADCPAFPPAARRAALLHDLAPVPHGAHRAAPLWQVVRVPFFSPPPVRWLLTRLE